MIPLTILYDEYIDRPKLIEQKNPVEYIVPPSPLKWGSEQEDGNVIGAPLDLCTVLLVY